MNDFINYYVNCKSTLIFYTDVLLNSSGDWCVVLFLNLQIIVITVSIYNIRIALIHRCRWLCPETISVGFSNYFSQLYSHTSIVTKLFCLIKCRSQQSVFPSDEGFSTFYSPLSSCALYTVHPASSLVSSVFSFSNKFRNPLFAISLFPYSEIQSHEELCPKQYII